ncbi:MAG: aspartyl-phosphate phosphatase Spo0E family protein [Bacillota bacterium]
MASDREKERLRQIEELRSELHRQMGGGYDPVRLAQLVETSQELDRLVVEVTRRQCSRGRVSTRKRGGRSRNTR